jgi:ATP-dependent Clp protease ATP-binding subunit ClpA
LDDGRLTDSKGRVIDFTNTLIIMTTNLGAKIIERESGIKPKSEQGEGFKITPDAVVGWEPVPEASKDPEIFERVTKLVNDELKNFFRPEFLNRIDEIVVFNHLTRIDTWEICDLMIKSVQNRLKDKGINLIVDLSVQAFLTDEGYDPMYGARPLRRAIMKYLEDTLAEQCLSKTLYPNTKIYVRRKKVEGTLMTYTNEIEVEVDFSDVDPNLLDASSNQEISTIVTKSETNLNETSVDDNKPSFELNDSNLEDDELKPAMAGKTSRFFKKKN